MLALFIQPLTIFLGTEIPPSTLFDALSKYLCISTIPSHDILSNWSKFCTDENEKEQLKNLSFDSQSFNQQWDSSKCPNILDFLKAFRSLKVPARTLVLSLKKLMPRIYSLASNEKELVFKGHVMTAVDLLIQMNQFKAGPFLNGDHDDGAIWSMRKGQGWVRYSNVTQITSNDYSYL